MKEDEDNREDSSRCDGNRGRRIEKRRRARKKAGKERVRWGSRMVRRGEGRTKDVKEKILAALLRM